MKTNLLLKARKEHTMKPIAIIFVLMLAFTFTSTNAQGPADPAGCTPLGTTGLTLDPTTVPMYINDLPVIKDLGLRVDFVQGNTKKPGITNMLDVTMEQTAQDLGLGLDDGSGGPVMTTVWGYKFPSIGVPTYPGATIVAMKDQPVEITWKNMLPAHFLPVDPSMHMAHGLLVDPDPTDGIFTPEEKFAEIKLWYDAGNVPTVAHLHGGHTESASDGLPEAWFTQSFAETGNYFVQQKYRYDNDQEAGTLWYHDHALGITRLNVYAGLAGFYLLRDKNENKLIDRGVIPSGDYEIEIVIQDRMFNTEGQLFWPAYPGEVPWDAFITPEAAANFPLEVPPSALAEYFGNIILVNGKAWPKLDVEPRKYRFRLLNGSDSRFYILKLDDGTLVDGNIMVIGTDDGLLESPVVVQELAIAPGERYDVVVDFTGYIPNINPDFAPKITVTNFGADGPAAGAQQDPADIACTETTGQIMQFHVTKPMSAIPDATVGLGSKLRNKILPIKTNAPARQLVLFEGMDEFGRLQPMLGTLADGSLTWSQTITENPDLDASEMWEVYNATGDAHPIHLHLVSFQILNREDFTPYSVDFNNDGVVDPGDIVLNVEEKPQPQHNGSVGIGGIFHLDPVTPLVPGSLTLPPPHEMGWKDTFIVPPGQVGRVIAHFDRPGRYVWHCHILSHEDHEMMRPFHVGPIPGGNLRLAATQEITTESFPNPFQSSTQIRFELMKEQNIDLTVFDMSGKLVYHNLDFYQKGKNAIFWDGFDNNGKVLHTGVYLYKLKGVDFVESKRLVIQR